MAIMKHSKKSPLNLTPGKNARLPRNSFDMSYHSYFTSPAGLLLPNYVQDVQPGDFLKLDVEHFSRTMPVNTAAFSRYKEITDFYFVPYRLLWKWFDQFVTGVNDIDSALSVSEAGWTGATSDVPSSIPALPSSVIVSALSDAVNLDDFGFSYDKFVPRLLDMLGYPVSNSSATTDKTFYTSLAALATPPSFNPFRLLAYQRLFYDFYRNTDYDVNLPAAYNIDNLAGGSTLSYVKDMFAPRYVQWRKDRFTAVKPQPLSTFRPPIDKWGPNNLEGNTSPSGTTNNANYVGATGSVSGSTSTLAMTQLRASLAADRLTRLTMLAPKNYEEQMRAHFGVSPDHCDYCRPRFLGSFDSSLNIGEVTATSSGTGTAGSTNVLGQLAGKGICSGKTNRPITSEFNEHGIVMGMHYFLPFSEYDSNRIDDFNIKFNRNDFYVPEYDALGLQPLKAGQFGINVASPSTGALNNVAGYQSRYMEYKTRVDTVHGLFQSGQSLRTWCTPRTAVTPSSYITSSSLKVSPKISDTIFAMSYDGSQSSDPFLCHFRFDATLVRNMSILGIPTL